VNELARAAQFIQHDKPANLRCKRAVQILVEAEEEGRGLVEDLKTAIAEHEEKGEVLKREALALRCPREAESNDPKGKGKARADLEDEDEDGADDSGLPKTHAGEEHRHKKAALYSRLRDSYLSLHRVKFLQGDVHHVLGISHEAEESAAYAAAEELRKELLKSMRFDSDITTSFLTNL
jgi:E3 ubiquitin-protein ligase SHPRH